MLNGPKLPLFNSPLETGIRTLILLDVAFPKSFDLTTLIWLDHLVVHTGDLGGPESLHPDVSSRSGELLVRRSLIYDGLLLMRQMHLVSLIETKEGLFFASTDYARPLIDLLFEKYTLELKQRAKWLISHINALNEGDLKKIIEKRMGLWDVEFQLSEGLNDGK